MKLKISNLTRKLVGASTLAVGLLLTQNAAAAPMYDASRWTNRLTFFTSYLTAGTHTIQTDTRPYGGADTVLHVLDTSLHQVAMNDDYLPWLTTGRNDSYLSFTAPTTGSYRILVRAFNSQGEARTNVIVDGATVLTDSPFGSYSVAAQWNAGDEFRAATASYGGSNDLLGFALDGAGNVIAGDDDSGPNFYSFLTLPSAGSGKLLRAGYPGQNYFGSTATLQAPPNAGNDSDGDGLTNSLESVIGTSMFNADSDSDTIPDGMEILGNNGWSFSEGGNGSVPNVWIELDYMNNANVAPPYADLDHDKAMIFQQDGKVISHIVLDDQLPYSKFIGLGGCAGRTDCVSFETTKDSYFSTYNPERKPFFHYAVFGDAYGLYNATTDSIHLVNSSGIASGQDVLVTLGKTTGASATWQAQLGTLIHEFGHDLGLSHNENGNDGPLGPNSLNAHRSVMNYRFQLSGVPTPWGSSTFRHTYSFGKANCDSCLTSPKLTCVNARNNGACADAPSCDCDVAEWDTLNFAFGNAGLGANAGQPGAAPVDPQDAVRRNQDARGAGKRKSDVARWIGPVPMRSKEARKRAFEAFLATSGRAGEYVLSEDGQALWTREGTHEGK